MELICEKYKVTMAEVEAECAHPVEHCQFRPACIINFLTREKARAARRVLESAGTPDGSVSPE